jgi:shikimate kinase
MVDTQKIFLIGYMGSGKTTIGKQLAKQLDLQFTDMDMIIENRYRKSISAIFEEKGETAFRETERKILLEIIDFENIVISTGGGTPCFFDNMELMNQSGITVYLQTGVDQLAARLKNETQTRPLIKNKDSEEIKTYIAANLKKREPFYKQAAIIFDNNALFSKENFAYLTERLIECIKHESNAGK